MGKNERKTPPLTVEKDSTPNDLYLNDHSPYQYVMYYWAGAEYQTQKLYEYMYYLYIVIIALPEVHHIETSPV